MAYQTAINPTTLARFSALSPSIRAQIWQKTMQEGVIANEWLSRFQGGEGSQMPIIETQDLNAGGGDQVNFTVASELVGDGVRGDSELVGNEELQSLNTYSCRVDFIRHATAATKRFRRFTAAQRKLTFTQMLSAWMARKKQHEALLSLVKATYTSSGIANNLLWAGGGSKDADLAANNILSTADFQLCRRKLVSLGARPANLSREANSEMAPRFVMWGPTDALSGLKNDSAWVHAQLSARPRENGGDARNPLFTGSFEGKEFDGILPYEFFNPDHDNPSMGAIGCPLQPRALTREALTANPGAGREILLGGSDADSSTILFAKDFPGYKYKFYSEETPAADANVYFAKIINPPGSEDAGKYEIISYVGSTGNDGNKLTVTRGINKDDADNYSGKHPANSLVVPCNESGVAYAHVIVIGAWGLLRAYGDSRETLETEGQDYEFKKGAAIEAVYGQTPAQRRDGKFRNFVVVRVALPNDA